MTTTPAPETCGQFPGRIETELCNDGQGCTDCRPEPCTGIGWNLHFRDRATHGRNAPCERCGQRPDDVLSDPAATLEKYRSK